MERHIFIQSNDKQLLGAKLAAYALATRGGAQAAGIPVSILNVDTLPEFVAFAGATYRRGNEYRTYDPDDLQSFTLVRFMPPERMGFQGRALVIDPDIFALADITELFSLELGEHVLAACPRGDAWDTSVMLLDCAKLTHWTIADILGALREQRVSYEDWMQLRLEDRVMSLPRIWNQLDTRTPETRMLHTTNRLTQPWKTGLPIDFTRNRAPRIAGILPREPFLKLLGKLPDHYQPHPDPAIESLFFALLKDALNAGAVTQAFIEEEIRLGHVRPDLLATINRSSA